MRSSPPPIIGRRLTGSSSFVPARSSLTGCGRSSWTPPSAAAGKDGSYEEEPEEQSASPEPGGREQAIGSNPHTLLTAGAPMGADMDSGGCPACCLQAGDQGFESP